MVKTAIDTALVVEKTDIPQGLKIEKETREKEIWYLFSQPILLPYDKDLLSKVEKGAKLSVPYFANVLQAFVEDTLPNMFPKNFYTMKLDAYNVYRIDINPKNHDIHQYSFGLDFLRTEKINIPNIPQQYKNMNIKTGVFLSSKIFHSAATDPITNGFFPRTKDGKIEPVA